MTKNYQDPKTETIDDWKWKPLHEVQDKLGLTEIPSHIQKFGQFMDDTARRASMHGLTPRDLIKAYTITRFSMQRKARKMEDLKAAGLWMPDSVKPGTLVRPEGAMGHWLHTKHGQRYLDKGEAGEVDEEAIADAQAKLKLFGKHEKDLPDTMRWAPKNLPGREARVSELVARALRKQSTPEEWRAEMSNLKGIRAAKAGFLAANLGRGDQPTLDARQIVEHTGRPSSESTPYLGRQGGLGAAEGVTRLAGRQSAMNLALPKEQEHNYQHLAHHAFWDKAANETTTHQDVMDALQNAKNGGRIERKRGGSADSDALHPLMEGLARAGLPGMGHLLKDAPEARVKAALKGVRSPFSDDPEEVQAALRVAQSLKVPTEGRLQTEVPYYGIKQPMWPNEVFSTVKPLPGATLKPKRQMSWEDLHKEGAGGSFINLGGDRSRSGVLTHVQGKKLAWPVRLYAGPEYMREYNPGSVWASAKGHSSNLLNLTKELSRGDKPVYGVYAPMGAKAADSAHHMFDALMAQVPGSNIDPAAAAKFDEALKAGLHMEPDKRGRAVEKMAKWPGIMNAKEASNFAKTLTGEQRSSIVKLMDKAPWLKAGFPSVGMTRVAITDPEVLNTPGNMIGHRVVRLDPDRVAKEKIKHTTYTAPTAGEYVGELPLVQRQYAMPDPTFQRMMQPAAGNRIVHPYSEDQFGRATTRKLFEEQKQSQQLTPQQLDNVQQGLERQQQYGLKQGGRVAKADGGPLDDPAAQAPAPPPMGHNQPPEAMSPSYIKPVDEDKRRLSPIGLYSHAADTVWKSPQMKASPTQFKAMLTKAGVKPDEFKWSGYDQAFAGKSMVTKREVRDHFVQNLPKIQETVKTQGVDRPHLRPGQWSDDDDQDETKYSDYQLPGGKNYREVVLHLKTPRVVDDKELGARLKTDFGMDWDTMSEPERAKMRGYEQNRPPENAYKSSHWDEPNPLLHLRMSDRTGPETAKYQWVNRNSGNGTRTFDSENEANQHLTTLPEKLHQDLYLRKVKQPTKILHVEELQSDWGQAARDTGIRNPERERVGTDEERFKAMNGVPAAPYIDSTAKWTDLGLKRVLHEAAKGGYDKVVVTPGEEQAKRYDLSRHIKELHYSPEEKLMTHRIGDEYTHSTDDISPEDLAKHVGKDAADKLLSAPLKKGPLLETPYHSLIGDDLKVGGHGMKGYYDTIVPKALEKLARQHDPEARVQLHAHDLPTTEKEKGASGWTKMSAGKIKGHALTITPKMKASILAGQKGYASGGRIEERVYQKVRKAVPVTGRYP